MSDNQSIWYRMGYAFEQARHRKKPRRLEGLSGRPDGRGDKPTKLLDDTRREPTNEILGGLGVAVMDRLGMEATTPDVRAGVTGAFAGVAGELVAAGVFGDAPDAEELRSALLRGATVGMIYGRLFDRWLPGPSWAKGLLLGLATHSARAWGGLPQLLGPLSPHRRIPLVADVFEPDREESESLWEHVVFGLLLAALYKSKRESKGISNDV